MEYKEILDNARGHIGPFCKVCPVCNGLACGNTVPGPGAKGPGSGFVRNYDKWQSVCVDMDTICETFPAIRPWSSSAAPTNTPSLRLLSAR